MACEHQNFINLGPIGCVCILSLLCDLTNVEKDTGRSVGNKKDFWSSNQKILNKPLVPLIRAAGAILLK